MLHEARASLGDLVTNHIPAELPYFRRPMPDDGWLESHPPAFAYAARVSCAHRMAQHRLQEGPYHIESGPLSIWKSWNFRMTFVFVASYSLIDLYSRRFCSFTCDGSCLRQRDKSYD